MKDYFCVAVGALGGVIASLFGGWDAALESRAGWKGLCRKGETLLIVLVACRLDTVMATSFVWDAVVIGFICNETLSIIENAGLMGLPIPAVITKAVDILKQRSEGPEGQKGTEHE